MPDRFTNPENAEEATALAAAESENAPSIDESMESEELLNTAAETEIQEQLSDETQAESQETAHAEEETREEKLD